jgi:hypothetical protein
VIFTFSTFVNFDLVFSFSCDENISSITVHTLITVINFGVTFFTVIYSTLFEFSISIIFGFFVSFRNSSPEPLCFYAIFFFSVTVFTTGITLNTFISSRNIEIIESIILRFINSSFAFDYCISQTLTMAV